ncbi:MAG: M42 family peptidase [Clostridia bacterium]|nr:M42 family peptidase [Clostridia bacterium]
MNIELLEKLCCTYGVSGCEKEVTTIITNVMKNLCDDIYVDKLGNIVCTKFGTSDKTITLDAHIDSVGFIVNKIYDNGFIGFRTIGGIDVRILSSQEVVIHGKKNICGIITSKPPHITDKKDTDLNIKDMFIDTGLGSDVDKLISIGDLISFRTHFDVLNDKYISGTSLDDRAGVATIINIFKHYKDRKLPYNLVGLFSVREEIGLKGAYFSKLKSDLMIVIDVTHAKTPDEKRDIAFECSKGVAIGYGPNIDKYYYDILIENALNKNIPHQIEILEGNSGTNAWAYQTLRQGTPCLLLSLPLKYMHTPVECISINDYDNMQMHLTEFLDNIHLNKIKTNNLIYAGDAIG